MNNKNLARALELFSRLLEFSQENEFKIKSYRNAAEKIEGFPLQVLETNLHTIDGIGPAISEKIIEFLTKGTFTQLEKSLSSLPETCLEFFVIPGLSPKKAGQIYHELKCGTVDEILNACNENKLIALKGFGKKTQDELKETLEFYKSNKGKFLQGTVDKISRVIQEELQRTCPGLKVSLTGEIRRGCEIVSSIEFLAGFENEKSIPTQLNIPGLRKEVESSAPFVWRGFYYFLPHVPGNTYEKYLCLLFPSVPIEIIFCRKEEFFRKLFITTGSKEHLKLLLKKAPLLPMSEEEIYVSNGIPYIIPELRENLYEWDLIKNKKLTEKPVLMGDIKGVIHVHSRYSDGKNTIKELAEECLERGYRYLGISDHSKAAFYAHGLNEERLLEQRKEIDTLNKELAPFHIFHGTECDILHDGKLDFSNEILKELDFVIVSIHSNINMDEEKAMKRLLTAIENPNVNILGHPTGRLLLRRPGYPVDHKKLIDACAANKVIIEINSNPYRLDLDWRWIRYAVEKEILFSINPDAHSINDFDYINLGVTMARKGNLGVAQILNCMEVAKVMEMFKIKDQ